MCGIVAAASRQNIVPILYDGLCQLEYRGYDSCGIAVVDNEKLYRVRSVSRVAELRQLIKSSGLSGETGIAHTRWATHGAVEIENAHPIFSHNFIGLVHNGIIENYEQLRKKLQDKGYVFSSKTDTEVIAHLIYDYYDGDLLESVKKAICELRGTYGIAVICSAESNTVVLARKGSPLVVGLGDGENFGASDAMALASVTNRIIYLAEGDICKITPEQVRIFAHVNENFVPVKREFKLLQTNLPKLDLGHNGCFMYKEILEQPQAISDTIENITEINAKIFGSKADFIFQNTKRILLLACGTSYYACLTAKYWIESISGIASDVEIASEFRYRNSIPNSDTLVVAISQSGETADTIAALRHAKYLGMNKTLAICNVSSSMLVQETVLNFITHAGIEIGVASTKAFTTQLIAVYILALVLAKLNGRLSSQKEVKALVQLKTLPNAIKTVLAIEPQIINWSKDFIKKNDAIFLARGIHYPIALEGALKLKEISYIHAEAFPAGELKHGPLALVDHHMPVITLAPCNELFEKIKSNMEEVRARGGILYVITDDKSKFDINPNLNIIQIPSHSLDLSPIIYAIPLQLLAFYTAIGMNRDVDKPRNLAKSVTVE